ncbi:hypothetical protein BJ165DRAFT_1525750 [Panaeolus papilionaceus]|nr:hypothetical protein BJ165DRAFT_1525750 [Panaeolus papilionaceus]
MRLSTRLSSHQGNHKLATTSLKRSITLYTTQSTQAHELYASHLAYITSLSIGSTAVSSGDASLKPLSAIRELHDLVSHNEHGDVSRLALVLELRELMYHRLWTRFGHALQRAEDAHDITFPVAAEVSPTEQTEMTPTSDVMKVLRIHVLICGLIFYTHVGDGDATQPRMKRLHDMLDSGHGALSALGPCGYTSCEFYSSSSPGSSAMFGSAPERSVVPRSTVVL